MWVKICATTNLADAQLAVDAGADAVGFVFAPSKRQVTTEEVSEITEQLPASIEKVGVFTTGDPYEVEHVVACAGLTTAQLHRPFDASFVRALSSEFGGKLKIIQTVAYAVDAKADGVFEAQLRAAFAEPAVTAVLLDAAKAGDSGGLGLTFPWTRVAEIVRRAQNNFTKPLIVAGGLTAENVAEAIATLTPWGVDVASGVETSPGKKDAAKVRAFIKIAKAARASQVIN